MSENSGNHPNKLKPSNAEKLFSEPLLIFYSFLFALGVLMIHAADKLLSDLFALPELDQYLFSTVTLSIDSLSSNSIFLTTVIGALGGITLFLLALGLDSSSLDSRKSRNMLARTLGSLPVWQGMLIILVSVAAEETFFRGGVQSLLGPSFAVLLFGAVHIKLGEGGIFTLWNLRGFVIGFVLSYFYAVSGSLIIGVMAHMVYSVITYIQLRKAFNREGLNAFLKASESGEQIEI